VPVSISYELDPCDAIKAGNSGSATGDGALPEGRPEDVAIDRSRHFAGSKGCVHVHFGTTAGGGFESPEAVAAAIDAQVIRGYRLHPTNLWAYRWLHGERRSGCLEIAEGSCSEAAFRGACRSLPEADRPLPSPPTPMPSASAWSWPAPRAQPGRGQGGIATPTTRIIEARGLAPRWGQRQMIAEVANPRWPGSRACGRGGRRGGHGDCGDRGRHGHGQDHRLRYPRHRHGALPRQAAGDCHGHGRLQEQLVHKDLPDIQRVAARVHYVLAKGRRRYLCLSQLDRLLAQESAAGRPWGCTRTSAEVALPGYRSMDLRRHARCPRAGTGTGIATAGRCQSTMWTGFRSPRIRGSARAGAARTSANCSFYRAREGCRTPISWSPITTSCCLILPSAAGRSCPRPRTASISSMRAIIFRTRR
jgi:hypothetical protein